MRIYIIGSKGIPSASIQGAGGVERHVEQVAVRLAERGHEVFVYVRNSSTYQVPEWNGVKLIRIPFLPGKNTATISHVFFSTVHSLFQKADIIHFHGVGPSTMSWIPRLFKWRTKVVSTFHSRDWFDTKWSHFARLYLQFGEWSATHFPHKTIAVSHVIQVFCRSKFKKHVDYIPNGADIPAPQGIDQLPQFHLKAGEYLLGVGRLVPNKAYDVAIEAFRNVNTQKHLVIVGEAFHSSHYDKKLRDLAAQDPRVMLLGYQSGEPLRQLLSHAHAFVHPSRAEGLSVAIIEAMANAKLVIMSDIKENLELVDHSGLAFPTDNVEALTVAMQMVVDDPEMARQRGLRAREVVHKDYSWESVILRLEALYKHLLVPKSK